MLTDYWFCLLYVFHPDNSKKTRLASFIIYLNGNNLAKRAKRKKETYSNICYIMRRCQQSLRSMCPSEVQKNPHHSHLFCFFLKFSQLFNGVKFWAGCYCRIAVPYKTQTDWPTKIDIMHNTICRYNLNISFICTNIEINAIKMHKVPFSIVMSYLIYVFIDCHTIWRYGDGHGTLW